MLKITNKNVLPSGLLGVKKSEEVQMNIYRRHYAPHLISRHICGRRRKRRANPETSASDSSRDSPSRVASHPQDDQSPGEASPPITKQVSPFPSTFATRRPAKNHTATATEALHKDAKHSHINNSVISTPASGPSQNDGETNAQATSSSTSTGTRVDRGRPIPNKVSTAVHQSQNGMLASTLCIIIGAAVLAILILGVCIWACWGSRGREGRRRSIWKRIKEGAKSDQFGISSFEEAHLEKSRPSDAKMLKSLRGKRLRGDSLSQKTRKARASGLWGSGVEMYDYPLESKYPDPEKDKQKSPYDDLDFGTMSTIEAVYPPVVTLPPIAHYSDAEHHYVAESVNGMGSDGGRHNTQFTCLASTNRVQEMPDWEPTPQGQNSRRKKDTIAGLTEAYGNVNGWGEVGRDFSDCPGDDMPRDLIPLQSCVPERSFSNLNEHTTNFPHANGTANLPFPRPCLVVNSPARVVFPEPASNTFAALDPTATSALMTPSAASKELEYMVNRLAQDLLTRSSVGGRGNSYDNLASGPQAINRSSAPFCDVAI